MQNLLDWLNERTAFEVLLAVAAAIFVGSLLATIVGAILVRLGMRRPKVVAKASSLTERLLGVVKRPLTIVVLDEVAAVIQTGHYTRNISDALLENHDELRFLIAEKVRADPNSRLIGRLPGYETLVNEVTTTTLRVMIEMLDDPRMDELVSDLLRNNIAQIRAAVRERSHESLGEPEPADPIPAHLRRQYKRQAGSYTDTE